MAGLTPLVVETALKDVFDPELGYNIVDLGLVYDIQVEGGQVKVVMTMTTIGCPAADYIVAGVKARLAALEGVASVQVDVVWSPPWSPDFMSDDAKAYFGYL